MIIFASLLSPLSLAPCGVYLNERLNVAIIISNCTLQTYSLYTFCTIEHLGIFKNHGFLVVFKVFLNT